MHVLDSGIVPGETGCQQAARLIKVGSGVRLQQRCKGGRPGQTRSGSFGGEYLTARGGVLLGAAQDER